MTAEFVFDRCPQQTKATQGGTREMDILTQPLAQFSLQIPGFGNWADQVDGRCASGTRVTPSAFDLP